MVYKNLREGLFWCSARAKGLEFSKHLSSGHSNTGYMLQIVSGFQMVAILFEPFKNLAKIEFSTKPDYFTNNKYFLMPKWV